MLTGLKDEIKVIESIMLDSNIKKNNNGMDNFNRIDSNEKKQDKAPVGLMTDRDKDQIHQDDSGSEDGIEVGSVKLNGRNNFKRL